MANNGTLKMKMPALWEILSQEPTEPRDLIDTYKALLENACAEME